MGRFHIKRKNTVRHIDTTQGGYDVVQGAVATTPERLMAALTNAMGEVVNSPEEFEELTAILIVQGPAWVKQVAKMRDFQAEVDRRKDAPPLAL